jgi:tRNA-specific 2-thiouridylase
MQPKLDLNQYAGEKVAVAMSGGVDSSVAAYLLKQAGAEVFGISMTTVPGSTCCSVKDITEAGEVAKQLGIEHKIISLRELFEKEAIQYFVDESLKGKNPNPCVPCNQKVKFGALMDYAFSEGAEYFATGHYARLHFDGRWILRRPVDEIKDQSYVLSMLSQDIYSKTIFPIGQYTKEEVRKIAEEAGIKVFDKPENQDLCFLHEEKGDFIHRWIGEKEHKEGNIVDMEGNIIGRHYGTIHYTIGQRKGLGIKSHERWYVYGIDAEKNEVIAGHREDLMSDHFYIKQPNWASIDSLNSKMNVEVLVRNKQVPKQATIEPEDGKIKVTPSEPMFGVSTGQIAVFCKDEVVLGGGWIC